MNDDYKNLEDINMSFKLWNNSYYNVIFKNIEDIKNKKEECLKKSKKYGYNVEETFEKYAEKIIKKIESKKGKLRSHMWDEYCKGFLAGQILGLPTEKNMILVDRAEELWKDVDKYGYYQEALEDAKVS